MKATNNNTDHNRTIELQSIPTAIGSPYQNKLPPSMKITINYTNEDIPTIDKAVSLDNIIIPEIINSVNLMNIIRNMFVGIEYETTGEFALTESEIRIVDFLIENNIVYVDVNNEIKSVNFEKIQYIKNDAAQFINLNFKDLPKIQQQSVKLFIKLEILKLDENQIIQTRQN